MTSMIYEIEIWNYRILPRYDRIFRNVYERVNSFLQLIFR